MVQFKPGVDTSKIGKCIKRTNVLVKDLCKCKKPNLGPHSYRGFYYCLKCDRLAIEEHKERG